MGDHFSAAGDPPSRDERRAARAHKKLEDSEFVTVRREDLDRARIIWENGYQPPYTVNDREALRRLIAALGMKGVV